MEMERLFLNIYSITCFFHQISKNNRKKFANTKKILKFASENKKTPQFNDDIIDIILFTDGHAQYERDYDGYDAYVQPTEPGVSIDT